MVSTFLSGDLAARRAKSGLPYSYMVYAAVALLILLTLGSFTRDGVSSASAGVRAGSSSPQSLFPSTCSEPSFGTATDVSVGTNPASMAKGDFNRDGNPDLAIANGGSSNVSVLLGDGNGGFGTATNFAAGTFPYSLAVGDFNNDGNPDLAVTDTYSDSVSVLLGNGSGSFGPPTNFGVGINPFSVAVGDFNGDGNPDLATANGGTTTVSVLLVPLHKRYCGITGKRGSGDTPRPGRGRPLHPSLHNLFCEHALGTGSGGFGTPTNFAAGTNPVSVAVGDFNGDGNPDLATANNNFGNVSVLLGNGNGGFGAPTNFGVALFPVSIATGDFNRDGLPDLATANDYSSNVSVLLNTCSAVIPTETPTSTPIAATNTPSADTPTATNTPTVTHTAPSSTPTPTHCSTQFEQVPSPNSGSSGNELDGIAVVSANDVWAVGHYANGTVEQTLTQHWNGTAWSIVPSPNSGPVGNILNGVVAVSTHDVWAVGYYGDGSTSQTLTEHWDGTAWSIVPSPNSGPVGNRLNAVEALLSTDVWAVGYDFDGATYRTLTEHWDGSSWSVVTSPDPGSGDSFLSSIAAQSGNDVWAVGDYYDGTGFRTLTEHWNGIAWSVVTSPNSGSGDNSLNGVAAVSANDMWAVGEYYSGSVHQTLAEHWNGTAWSIIASPNTGYDNILYGIAAVSPNDVWAVGYYDSAGFQDQVLTEHWNGTAWSIVPSSGPGSGGDRLVGIGAVSASDVWGVGAYSVGYSQTLVERYNPCPGSPTPTPTPCAINFSDVHPADYFHDAVIYLACHGAISGYADGTFRPYNNTTRGQVTKIVILGFGIPIDTIGGPHFSDVPTTHPFYEYVETANHNGIASGYSDGTFRPFNNVTRGQLSKIVSVAAVQMNGWTLINPPAPTFIDVAYGSPFYEYVETAVSKGVVSGYSDHTFRPGNDATRGQIAKITYLAVITP